MAEGTEASRALAAEGGSDVAGAAGVANASPAGDRDPCHDPSDDVDDGDAGRHEPETWLAVLVMQRDDGEDRARDAEEEGEEVERALGESAAVVDRGALVEAEEGEGEGGGEGVEGEDEEGGRGHQTKVGLLGWVRSGHVDRRTALRAHGPGPQAGEVVTTGRASASVFPSL